MQPHESEDILYWSMDCYCGAELLYSVLNELYCDRHSSSVWTSSSCEYVKKSCFLSLKDYNKHTVCYTVHLLLCFFCIRLMIWCVSCAFGSTASVPTDQSRLSSLAPEVNFPSFQAWMENTNTAHNHLRESDIFLGSVLLYMALKKIIMQ